MMLRRYDLVMALFPNARGIAHVVFEGPLSPVDWGITDPRGDRSNRKTIRRITALFERYAPDALVLRDRARLRPGGRRRLYRLLEAIEELAETRGLPTAQVSPQQVRESFACLGTPTRYAIAEAIAKHIPLFEPYVPPVRKIWKSEDRRMGLFDAAALAMTFYRSLNAGAHRADGPRNAGSV